MPLYDYRCKTCATAFELLVRSGTAPSCPHCGGGELERTVSRVAPAGKTAGIVAGARRQAAREGHFSHYSRGERAKLPK
jgi:putative FmdB family regulatory protein